MKSNYYQDFCFQCCFMSNFSTKLISVTGFFQNRIQTSNNIKKQIVTLNCKLKKNKLN